MNTKHYVEIISIFVALLAVVVAIGQWFFPFNPIGPSPFKPSPTAEFSTEVSPYIIERDPAIVVTTVFENIPTQVVANCLPVLFTEDFNSLNDGKLYGKEHFDKGITLHDWRLEFNINNPHLGVTTTSLGQYDNFILEFYVFPVGEIYDGSINMLLYKHGFGGYEIQVRPRSQEFQILKEIVVNGETKLEGMGWTKNEAIKLGGHATKFRLDATPGNFTFWVNDEKIYNFVDKNPFLRGEIRVGIGAGEISPITMQIDDITICGH